MEELGRAYGVLLNTPELRRAVIVEAEPARRPRPSRGTGRALRALRAGLAHALRVIASHLEPIEPQPAPPTPELAAVTATTRQ